MSLRAQMVLRGKAHRIFLLHGIDHTGRSAWYYLYVPERRAANFEAAVGLDMPLTLTDYGDILLSGYGDEPPAETVQSIKRMYA